MKQLLCILLTLSLALSLAACSGGKTDSGASGSGSGAPASSAPAEEHIEGSVEELLGKVTEGAADPELSLVTTQADPSTFEWYFFIPCPEGAEGWVSEPMIGSIPHFIGLLRVPEGTDAEEVRTSIEENLNPQKWVCVEAEKTAVLRRGDLILVAMAEGTSVDKAVDNFQKL